MNLGEEHEDDVPAVGVQGVDHLFVQGHQLGRRGIGREEGREEVAEAAVLQDGLQDVPALRLNTLDKHLETAPQHGEEKDHVYDNL